MTKPNREVALTLLREGHTSMYRRILPEHEELFDLIDELVKDKDRLEDEVTNLEADLKRSMEE